MSTWRDRHRAIPPRNSAASMKARRRFPSYRKPPNFFDRSTPVSKRILIVDDSASVRQVAGMALARAGYEVVEAVDGEDGVSKLSGKLHLIISDVNMPRL